MNIVIKENYDAMSEEAARIIWEEMTASPGKRKNISITNGKTPILMYEKLIKKMADRAPAQVHYYTFDEIPVKGQERGITRTSLDAMFFHPAHIDENHIHTLDQNNYRNYDEKIKEEGGMDFIVIGIGTDGHFCGNLSGTLQHFGEGVKAVPCDLNERLKKRMAFLCGGADKVMPYYVTFGPKTVMNVKQILLIANGIEKAEIVNKAIAGEVDLLVPASILQLHPNVTVLLDKDAASLLTKKVDND